MSTHRRLDIEGLRAVAVLAVLLYHLHVPSISGGFAGVDVFFVISGFVITAGLVREVTNTGRVAVWAFYAKRARRLLPAALTVTVVTLLAGLAILPTYEHKNLVYDSLGATLYSVNWVFAARSVDYLAEDAGVSPLQHYWSLSIEEQFYLLWPVAILVTVLLTRRLGWSWRPVTVSALTVIAAGSLWLSVTSSEGTGTAYFITHLRVWELAAGALLAFAVGHLARLPRAVREVLTLAGLAAILVSVTAFDASTTWPGSAALVPVLGTAAVIAGGTGTLVGRALSIRPMVIIGGLSYAIYLWHWPLLVLTEARFGELSAPALAVVGGLSIGLAWATKHVIEDPVRRAGWPTLRTMLAAGTGMALVCTASLTVLATRPTLDDVDLPEMAGPTLLVADPDADTWTLTDDLSAAITTDGPIYPDPDLAPEDKPSYYDDGCQIAQGDPAPRFDCIYGDTDSDTEIVMLGDSKAGQWFSAVDQIARDNGWRLTTYLKSACPLTVGGAPTNDCTLHGRAVVDHIVDQDVPPKFVLFSTGAARTPELEAGVREAVAALQGTGTQVILLADTPYAVGGGSRYQCAAEHPDDLTQCAFETKAGAGGAWLTELGLRTVNLSPWVCPDETSCPVAIGGQLIWRQGSHITDSYARSLTPFLARELLPLVGDTTTELAERRTP